MLNTVQVASANTSITDPAALASRSGSKPSVVNSDFETFIKMLTVQVENQDPLNPIDSTDFATQLATFSGVEQQVLTNELLSSFSSQMEAGGLSEVSGWIGMEARAVVPVILDGSPVKLSLAGAVEADEHEMIVRDPTGSIVTREGISGQRQTVHWPGTDEFGKPLPPGTYDVSVVSRTDGVEVARTPAEVHSRISEARLADGETRLVLAAGQELSPENVLGLRELAKE